jgi:hypothetical protein
MRPTIPIAQSSPVRHRGARRAALLGLAFGVAVGQALLAPTPAAAQSARPSGRRGQWLRFAAGFGSSIVLHEAGHVAAAYAVGGRPSFGFDRGRPTVFSGLDADRTPEKQFIFSTAGLAVQALVDELILEMPHGRGGSFERGVLAGGIATAMFYATIGRNASVSDVTFMSRTSSLSKTEASLIFASIAALHALRISRDERYANFFAMPDGRGRLAFGVRIE